MKKINLKFFRFISIFCGLVLVSACQQQNIRPASATLKPASTDIMVIKIDLTQKETPVVLAPAPKPKTAPITEAKTAPVFTTIKVQPQQATLVQDVTIDEISTNTMNTTKPGSDTPDGDSDELTQNQQTTMPSAALPVNSPKIMFTTGTQNNNTYLTNIGLNPPKRIALAMPLHGKLGKVGQAVVDGFMAAHFEDLSSLKEIPYIKVYDSTKISSPDALYLQASMDQIDLIIGPLDKSKVIELSKKEALPIPTLALNYTPLNNTNNTTTNLIQFGLAVEDETSQIAQRSSLEGHQRILILHQDQPWAIRGAQHFTNSWLALGGEIADQVSFSGSGDHSKSITEALLITQSNERAETLKKHLSNTENVIKFEPRRRQDIDAIVLFALPTDGRQIIPTLAFHFAAQLPVYATHHIYQGPTDTSRDRDLEKVVFTDLPWLIEQPAMQKKISQTWLDRQRYTRLFAVGVDAYHLYPKLGQLSINSNKRMIGVTGVLNLNEQKRIVTQSSWGKFRSGKVIMDSVQ